LFAKRKELSFAALLLATAYMNTFISARFAYRKSSHCFKQLFFINANYAGCVPAKVYEVFALKAKYSRAKNLTANTLLKFTNNTKYLFQIA